MLNVKHVNELTYLISSEEILTESIKNVKVIIEKITNRIEMSGGLIERPKISCLKRKHPVSTSSTNRKKFKDLLVHKLKKHPFAGRFGVTRNCLYQMIHQMRLRTMS